MRKNIIYKIIISNFILLSMLITNSYGKENGTVRMEIKEGVGAWTNISISDSYEECESLNSPTSTLGTSALEAHLTTDADWSAMALFSVSQYGGSTSNSPAQTNGNSSGIYDIGYYSIRTTGILYTADSTSTEYASGLFNADGTVKKYIKKWPTNREETGFVGFIDTWGWHGAAKSYGDRNQYPISSRSGLFGVTFGWGDYNGGSTGQMLSNETFRPVIWN